MKKTSKSNKQAKRAPTRSTINNIADPKPYPLRLLGFQAPAPSPMSPQHHCYMVLSWEHANTSANPGFENFQVKLNSLFQPVGGAGEYGYGDEFTGFYSKWRILSSAIVIQASDTTKLDDVVLYPTVLASEAAASCQGAREHRHAKSDLLAITGNKAVVTLRDSITMSDLVGGSWRDDDYAGTGAADPDHVCYWNIATAPRSAAQAAVYLNGKVIAEVLFTELKPSTSS